MATKLDDLLNRLTAKRCAAIKARAGDLAALKDLRQTRLFATDDVFWINLQAQHDLETTRRDMHKRIEAEVTPLAMAALPKAT